MKPLPPLNADLFDYPRAQHLLNRAGFGGSPADVRALANMGLDGAVEFLVDYLEIDAEPIRADRFNPDIMQPMSRQDRTRLQAARRGNDEVTLTEFRQRRQEAQRRDRQQMKEIQQWWLSRMITTPRPLEEKMTLFWHGHFATNYRGIQDSYHMFLQNQLFRHNAVGNFKALSHGIIRDPAMLRYLNNDQNRKQKPNENLARELMELFTLGEGHGYTEQDIKQGARALTGYTYRDDEFITIESPQYRKRHDIGSKTIMGKSGNWNGDDFVDIIFSRRACSEFLCWKLYRYFVNDLAIDPDQRQQDFIVAMAMLLRQQKFHVRPVLKTLFSSEHFYDPANVGSQIKSPVQLIVQTARSLQAPKREVPVLSRSADLMGQSIFFPPSVKGWEGGRAWINTSTLFVRQNTMVYMLTGRRAGGRRKRDHPAPYDPAYLIEHLRDPGGSINVRDAVTYLLRINLAAGPHTERVDSLVEFVEARGGWMDGPMIVALLSLITAMPEYQLC